MAQIGKLLCVAGCMASMSLACSSDETPAYVRPKGRGSTGCQAWQKAVCDLAAVQCGLVSETTCVESYYSLTCLDDAAAQSCATAIKSATCTTGLPTGCNTNDLADPAPAIAACNTMLTAMCSKISQCGGGTIETCMTSMQAQIDCTTAIGYTSGYEVCMSDLTKMTCTAADFPDSCQGVVLTGSG
jgi:hypothetical protein